MIDFDYNEQAVLNELENVYQKMQFMPNLHSGDMQEIIRHINGLRYVMYAHQLRRLGKVSISDEPFYEVEIKVEPKWGGS